MTSKSIIIGVLWIPLGVVLVALYLAALFILVAIEAVSWVIESPNRKAMS